jgi:hypothetical protein
MIEHFALELCGMWEQLTTNLQWMYGGDETAELPAETKKSVAKTGLRRVIEQSERLNLGHSVTGQAKHLYQRLLETDERFTAELLARDLQQIKKDIHTALGERRFAYISPPHDQYFEKERLFGDSVYEEFPEAREDVKDAGNCLAASLPTASVFHLMRVAEFGLRRIADKTKVRLKDKRKAQPIEYATWDKVIQGIAAQIAAARALPHGPRKNKRLQFYSDAAERCTYIRDLWRNDVSHTRKRYSESEALGIMGRVQDFMKLLANGTP